MKRILHLLIILMACTGTLQAQTNSVELKNGTGTLISQHNSVSAAYGAIPATLGQAYIIELTAAYTGANETYPIIFSARAGASANNTITLRPAAGVTSVSISTTLAGGSMFQLNDADYVILDGRPGGTGTAKALTFNNGGTTSSSNTIQLINGACHNIIRYCTVNNGTTGSAGRGIHFSTSASNTSGNSDNLVEFCTVNSGRYAINTNGTAANKNSNNKIYGCDIVNIIFVGIWWQSGSGNMIIDSNRFYCTTASGDTPYGILFDAQTDTVIMTRNRIYDLNHGTATGLAKAIVIRSVSGTNYSLIYNNFIALSSANPNCTSLIGIEYAGSATTNADIYFNTVRVEGTLSGGTSGNVVSAAFNKTASAAASIYNIRNNIFVNERTGGTAGVQHLAASLTSTAGTINANYNTYGSATGDLVRLGTTVFTSMATYQPAVAPNDAQANITPVQFVSATDLHLAGASIGNTALQGAPATLPTAPGAINTDIDGDPRSATVPYRGGDEGAVVACAAPTGLAATVVTATGANLAWNATGGATGYEYAVITGATPPASGTATTATGYNATGLTASTTYYLHVRTKCGATTFSAWTTIPFTTTAPVCNPPATVSATNISLYGADISWTAVTGAIGYEYAVLPGATPPANGTATTGTTYSTTALSPSTTYYVHVRTICGPASFSVWNTIAFTTPNPTICPDPAPVNVSNISPTGADMGWSSVSGAAGYQYAITSSATPPASGTNIATTSYSATTLTPGTTYYVHVRTQCTGGSYSAWVSRLFTTTTPPCVKPLPTVTNITTGTVDIGWPAVSGAVGYEFTITNSSVPLPSGTNTTVTSQTIAGLTDNTLYYLHVRTNCGAGGFSTWATVPFTTAAYCTAPTAIFSNITAGSVDVNWNAMAGAVSYEYVLTRSITPPAGGTNTTGLNYNAKALLPGTEYYMHLRSICGADVSNWSTSGVTTPFETGIANAPGNNGLQLYPNPAKDHITITANTPIKEVRVYDAMGALVLQRTVNSKSGTIETAQLANGVYTMRIHSQDGTITRQFSIVK